MRINKADNTLREQVLKTLLYFDIFRYPLKANEIFRFLQIPRPCQREVVECLNTLIRNGHVFQFGEFYSLHPDEEIIRRRVKGNIEADKWQKVARRRARLIAKFPFVKAVMASGSLSKGYMDEKSDLDFFIITDSGRLWIARTMLVLFKRIFLFNSHKHFCVNYFVDAEHLEIEEKNLFTATELATLLPLVNERSYADLLAANRWVYDYFPNLDRIGGKSDGHRKKQLLKALCEAVLSPIASWLDASLLTLARRRWKRLYAHHYSREDFEIAFKSRRYVSKNHPNYYQKKVLDLYQHKVAEFKHRLAMMPYE